MPLDEAQERRVLIGDTRHGDGCVKRAGQERLERSMGEVPVCVRDGITMRVEGRPSEHVVHAFDQAIGHHMLHLLGIVVDLVPAHAHHLHQEQLDEAVTAQHTGGEFLTRAGQADTVVGLVGHQA